MALVAGQLINNRYRIVKLLGQGGFGAVYRAWDINLQRPMALKENLDISQEAQRQFTLEAQILGNLVHPNLPRVTDHFIIPGQGQYLVMDFVEGQDLDEMLTERNGPLPVEQALFWAAQVCDALAYLHAQNPPIVHRDIKPANIKVTPEGKAMLVDFGIAKRYDPSKKTTLGARAVTQGYSPPEQYGQGSTDAQSDVYALGATLYHLLTGVVPAPSINIMVGSQTPPAPASSLNPEVTPEISHALQQAMQMDRTRRTASIIQFKGQLLGREQLTLMPPSPVSATPVPPTQVVGAPPGWQAGQAYQEPAWQAQQATPPPAWQPRQAYPITSPPAVQRKPAIPAWVWLGIIGVSGVVILGLLLVMLFRGGSGPTPTPADTVVLVQVQPSATVASLEPTSIPPTETSAPVVENIPPSTNTLLPPPPQQVDTPAPALPPLLYLDQSYHCRGGPSSAYPLVRDLNTGTTLDLFGWDGYSWFLVKLADPSTRKQICWVSGGDLIQGSLDQLLVCQWEGDGYTANPSCR